MILEIPLSNSIKRAKISSEDFDKIGRFSWFENRDGYACRMSRKDGKRVLLLMHREILGAPKGTFVDHKNHDTLDNTRENIRLATWQQNQMNRQRNKVCRAKVQSRFKGVAWNPLSRSWHATIRFQGQRISLGYFKSDFEAAQAYNEGAAHYFGEFAYPNKLNTNNKLEVTT